MEESMFAEIETEEELKTVEFVVEALRPICKHCNLHPERPYSRGLCSKCYLNTEIRHQYEKSKFAPTGEPSDVEVDQTVTQMLPSMPDPDTPKKWQDPLLDRFEFSPGEEALERMSELRWACFCALRESRGRLSTDALVEATGCTFSEVMGALLSMADGDDHENEWTWFRRISHTVWGFTDAGRKAAKSENKLQYRLDRRNRIVSEKG